MCAQLYYIIVHTNILFLRYTLFCYYVFSFVKIKSKMFGIAVQAVSLGSHADPGGIPFWWAYYHSQGAICLLLFF